MARPCRIRAAAQEDESSWRALWREYTLFYRANVPDSATDATWARILDDRSAVHCLMAEDGQHMLGFVNYVIHPRTWSAQDTCYMEDLYVAPTARRKGVARALCTALKDRSTALGLSKIYWNTEEGNTTARRLYDTIGYKDDFIRYNLLLKKQH